VLRLSLYDASHADLHVVGGTRSGRQLTDIDVARLLGVRWTHKKRKREKGAYYPLNHMPS